MLTQILWWTCNGLIALLIARAVSRHCLSEFPVFYLYLGLVLTVAFLRFYFFTFQPNVYGPFYWYTEFVSIAIGYGIIWEIYERALTGYPGSLRMARYLVGSVFVLI